MRKIAAPVFLMTFCALLVACGNPSQRLDEHVFYDGPQFKLKVVRYYRNIPFNQLGEQAIVMCQSENTMKSPAYDQQDAGWRMLGAEDARDSQHAEEAALGMQDDYVIFNDQTLIAKMNVFNISFDACGHFINWDPGRLPLAMKNPVKKPDSCAPNGPVDCRYYDFEGDRAPRYEQISVAGTGQVSFTASSPTFRNIELLRVQTRNNGAVWHVDTVTTKAGKERAAPDTLRSLAMSSLETGMDDISLMDWLESGLPPGSMVIWPDGLGSCGEQRGAGEQASALQCAVVHFNDTRGNSGALYIAMSTGADNTRDRASFHSGVYNPGDLSIPVESLAGLHESLASGTE